LGGSENNLGGKKGEYENKRGSISHRKDYFRAPILYREYIKA